MKITTAQEVARWLAANSIGVLGVDEPEDGHGDFDHHNPHVVNCAGDISILVYEELGTASAVLRGNLAGRTPRILDPVDTYLAVVANVRSLQPPKPKARQPLTGLEALFPAGA